jgi:NtrC-family two-component system response regulator AlgB
VILSPASVLELQDLGLRTEMTGEVEQLPARPVGSSNGSPPVLGQDFSIEEIEREHIAQVVIRVASFEAAARVLGIDPTTLQRKRKRYGLA